MWINPFTDAFYAQQGSGIKFMRQATESLPMTATTSKHNGKPLHMNVVNAARFRDGPLPILAPVGGKRRGAAVGRPPNTAPARCGSEEVSQSTSDSDVHRYVRKSWFVKVGQVMFLSFIIWITGFVDLSFGWGYIVWVHILLWFDDLSLHVWTMILESGASVCNGAKHNGEMILVSARNYECTHVIILLAFFKETITSYDSNNFSLSHIICPILRFQVSHSCYQEARGISQVIDLTNNIT